MNKEMTVNGTTPTFPCPTTLVAAAVGISAEHIAA